jgi:hypothetical protein
MEENYVLMDHIFITKEIHDLQQQFISKTNLTPNAVFMSRPYADRLAEAHGTTYSKVTTAALSGLRIFTVEQEDHISVGLIIT